MASQRSIGSAHRAAHGDGNWTWAPALTDSQLRVREDKIVSLACHARSLLQQVSDSLAALRRKLADDSASRAADALAGLGHLAATCGAADGRLVHRAGQLVHRVTGFHLAAFARGAHAEAERLASASALLQTGHDAEAVRAFAARVAASTAALALAAQAYHHAIDEVVTVLRALWRRCGDRFHIQPPPQLAPHLIPKPTLRIYLHPLLGGGETIVPGLPMPGGPTVIPLPAHLVQWEQAAIVSR